MTANCSGRDECDDMNMLQQSSENEVEKNGCHHESRHDVDETADNDI